MFVAKASSSKKVQRAARAAASSKGTSERRPIGFPLVVVLIVLLGIGLVVAARGSRDPITSPTTADHWHSAYTMFDCGTPLPRLSGSNDPDGIHSHNDSIIHIHPRNSSATGSDARIGVFLDTMNANITTEGIYANNGEFAAVLAADGCNGEPAAIKAARWELQIGAEPTLVEVFEDNFRDIRLLGDGEGFSFARVPVAEDPPPPLPEVVSSLVGVGAAIDYVPPTTTTPDLLTPPAEGTVQLTPIPEDPNATTIPENGPTPEVVPEVAPDVTPAVDVAPAVDETEPTAPSTTIVEP